MDNNKKNKTQFDKVVMIPTDFSEVCDNAIHHGVELAQSLNFRVCILHVIDKHTKAFLKKEELGNDYIVDKLNTYKVKYEKSHGVPVDTIAREGTIFSAINDIASEVKAHLMILGTHGKQGLQYLFGSYALKVVVDSPCPVIVVQNRSFGKGYHKILFPVSNDLEPRQKVQWAMMMARLFNSSICLFQAYEKDSSLSSRLQIITRQITKILEENKISFNIVEAEKSKDFAEDVVTFAKSNNVDMIMTMTGTQADVPGFSAKAWDERLMFNETEIPVMCINPVTLGFYYYDYLTLT